MKISSSFDSGNIELIKAKSPREIQLKIQKDTNSDYLQWFYFRVQGLQGFPCEISIVNAGQTSYPFWDNYAVRASYDRKSWFTVPTSFDNGILKIKHMPQHNSVFYAYFAPFTYEQHLDLVHTAQQSRQCVLNSIGSTIEGKDIDLLTVGEPYEGKKNIWIIARQHPGESMAEWFMKGLIEKLLDENDPVSGNLLNKAVFYLVPNMNIDGSIAGNLRCNIAGANLNREWAEPDPQRSPEVYHVRNLMDETGVDLFLDIHGDEELPYNFISGIEGVPSYDTKFKKLQEDFMNKWVEISPDFQTQHGYPVDAPNEGNPAIASNQIAQRFGCLSLTVEMPFKDNKDRPNPTEAWSPQRSQLLGQSILQVINSELHKY